FTGVPPGTDVPCRDTYNWSTVAPGTVPVFSTVAFTPKSPVYRSGFPPGVTFDNEDGKGEAMGWVDFTVSCWSTRRIDVAEEDIRNGIAALLSREVCSQDCSNVGIRSPRHGVNPTRVGDNDGVGTN